LSALECDKCPEYSCQSAVAAGQVKLTPTESPSVAPQVAGGVVGGVLLIATFVFLVWKYALKGKRRAMSQSYENKEYPMEKPGHASTLPRNASSARSGQSRASTHTTTSMASTVLTRASNIIQIAYIPGVTNRAGEEHPPVPPVPIPTNQEQLLFHPTDLRSSAYTDISEFANMRKSVTPSLARTSIASAYVRDTGVAVMKAKPTVVSVQNKGSAASSPGLPPMPYIDMKRFVAQESSVSGLATPGSVLVKIPASSDGVSVKSSTPSTRSPLSSGVPMRAKTITLKRKQSTATSVSTTSSTLANEGASSPTLGPDTRAIDSRITSIADSMATTNASPHVRAKQFVADGEESSDEEDDDAPGDRTRKSILRKTATSPFTDAAAVDKKEEEDKRPGTSGEGPFSDNHAL
jgi:hypothetical protein